MHENHVFIQGKAFANAVANLGASRTIGFNKFGRKKLTERGRGIRARGQGFRGTVVARGSRGLSRGVLRWVRKPGLPWRKQKAFERRDRFMSRENVAVTSKAPPSFAGTPGNSVESRQ